MWADAESDATPALSLDPSHLKCRLRRSTARMELGYAHNAMEDAEAGLALDPKNIELLSVKDRALKALGVPPCISFKIYPPSSILKPGSFENDMQLVKETKGGINTYK